MPRIAIRLLSALCGLAAAVALPAAAADAKPALDSYVLPTPPTQFPEGVAYDERSGRYYVTSQANGAILTGFLHTREADILAAPGDAGRTSANGLDTNRKWTKLWVATGQLGRIDLLNPRSGATLRTFSMAEGSYANDVAVTKKATYATDSRQPTLWRVRANSTASSAEPWIDLTGSPITYAPPPAFNLNGIEATRDGHWLVTVQSNTGKLFRISTKSKAIREIAVGEPMTNGDGLVLRGRTLWVVRNANAQIVKLKLSKRLTSARVMSTTTNSSFKFPTTADIAKGRMLVVNSQFNRRQANDPELPFTLSSIRVP